MTSLQRAKTRVGQATAGGVEARLAAHGVLAREIRVGPGHTGGTDALVGTAPGGKAVDKLRPVETADVASLAVVGEHGSERGAGLALVGRHSSTPRQQHHHEEPPGSHLLSIATWLAAGKLRALSVLAVLALAGCRPTTQDADKSFHVCERDRAFANIVCCTEWTYASAGRSLSCVVSP